MTTLTIVLTGAYLQTQAWQGLDAANNITSILVTQKAFNTVIPFGMGGTIIAIASFVFGYTTLLGWSYYGEKCIEYLGGDRVIKPYRYIFIAVLFFGAILTPIAGDSYNYLNIVWHIGNIGNALMAFPNLVGLIFLAGTVAAVSRSKFYK
jgi:AGCS family alanine or glycine:cation symporter